MSKNLEIAIMVFLFVLLVILFRWSENGRYQVNVSSAAVFVDTRTGDSWLLHSKEMIPSPIKGR